jgi:hypothetical protein
LHYLPPATQVADEASRFRRSLDSRRSSRRPEKLTFRSTQSCRDAGRMVGPSSAIRRISSHWSYPGHFYLSSPAHETLDHTYRSQLSHPGRPFEKAAAWPAAFCGNTLSLIDRLSHAVGRTRGRFLPPTEVVRISPGEVNATVRLDDLWPIPGQFSR